MKKTIFLIITVLTISVLSGCVDNKTGDAKTVINSTAGIESKVKTDKASNDNYETLNLTDGAVKITGSGTSTFTGSGTSTLTGTGNAEWCRPGSKIKVQQPSGEKEFSVIGLTTHEGREVCQAEFVYPNGKSTRYFSKDGKYDAVISNASGSGGVYSEARSQVNSSG